MATPVRAGGAASASRAAALAWRVSTAALGTGVITAEIIDMQAETRERCAADDSEAPPSSHILTCRTSRPGPRCSTAAPASSPPRSALPCRWTRTSPAAPPRRCLLPRRRPMPPADPAVRAGLTLSSAARSRRARQSRTGRGCRSSRRSPTPSATATTYSALKPCRAHPPTGSASGQSP